MLLLLSQHIFEDESYEQITSLKAEMSLSAVVSFISLLVCLSAAKFLNTVFPNSNAFSLSWLFRKITFKVNERPLLSQHFCVYCLAFFTVELYDLAQHQLQCVCVLPLIPLPRLLSRFYIRFDTVLNFSG